MQLFCQSWLEKADIQSTVYLYLYAIKCFLMTFFNYLYKKNKYRVIKNYLKIKYKRKY